MKIFKNTTAYVIGLLYIIVGLKHFITPNFFIAIVPPFLIYRSEIVLISGLIEVCMGFLLLFKKTRRIGAYITILLLIAVFPANIYLYLSELPRDIIGISKNQALFRMPFQIPLIILAYWHSKNSESKIFSIICLILFIPTIIYFATI